LALQDAGESAHEVVRFKWWSIQTDKLCQWLGLRARGCPGEPFPPPTWLGVRPNRALRRALLATALRPVHTTRSACQCRARAA